MTDDVTTTRMSTKGQVVIPEEIRRRLHLSTGMEFIVIGNGDSIILKAISAPPIGEFKELLKGARKAARATKLTSKNVNDLVQRVRRRRS